MNLLAIFFIGLALNLTPCVYPMLSVTVSIFSKNRTLTFWQAFPRALVYVLGLACMYSVLGVAAALSGNVFGAWLQNRWALMVIGGLIGALALSMFGVFRFEAPAWLLTKLGGKARVGWGGLFISGALVGVFAAPCIGPPVAALIAHVGSLQDPVAGFWMFFVLSLGLGLPYLLLGSFSSLFRLMPKSGEWLVWVERLFGVVLAAFAAYYFLVAFYPAGLRWLVPVALIAGGVYLGFFEKSGNASKPFKVFKIAAGIAAILMAVNMITAAAAPKNGLEWQLYNRQVFTSAKAEGKPIILDFYADWCIPCHEMEATTYRDPRVIAALERFAKIKVDLTDDSRKANIDLAEELGVYGMPTTVFYDSAGEEVKSKRALGYVGAPEMIAILESIE